MFTEKYIEYIKGAASVLDESWDKEMRSASDWEEQLYLWQSAPLYWRDLEDRPLTSELAIYQVEDGYPLKGVLALQNQKKLKTSYQSWYEYGKECAREYLFLKANGREDEF